VICSVNDFKETNKDLQRKWQINRYGRNKGKKNKLSNKTGLLHKNQDSELQGGGIEA
jgi:hypothetical protein